MRDHWGTVFSQTLIQSNCPIRQNIDRRTWFYDLCTQSGSATAATPTKLLMKSCNAQSWAVPIGLPGPGTGTKPACRTSNCKGTVEASIPQASSTSYIACSQTSSEDDTNNFCCCFFCLFVCLFVCVVLYVYVTWFQVNRKSSLIIFHSLYRLHTCPLNYWYFMTNFLVNYIRKKTKRVNVTGLLRINAQDIYNQG